MSVNSVVFVRNTGATSVVTCSTAADARPHHCVVCLTVNTTNTHTDHPGSQLLLALTAALIAFPNVLSLIAFCSGCVWWVSQSVR